jgi:tRNA/tmRNA/rRNA uracil-C5-methylase (TrmA/RlmC/RlmD family)
VLACDPERVVLVSCDAAALARDIGLLVAAGFGLASVTLVDLFAHTPHVECVTVLDR